MSVATDISRELWGGVLVSDNRGFYTALEFLALASSIAFTPDDDPATIIADLESGAHIDVPGHILARRFAFDPDLDFAADEVKAVAPENFIVQGRVDVVRAVLADLKMDVPGQGKAGRSWHGSHLLPYGQGLSHWDARMSRGHLRKERIYYRGAGTLLLKIIFLDPNINRRSKTLAELHKILNQRHFLGELLNLFHQKDFKAARQPLTEHAVLRDSSVRDDRWDEIVRDSVSSIVTHPEAPVVVKLDALFHILPLVTILLQLNRSAAFLEESSVSIPLVVDCSPAGTRTNEVRQAAHRSFAEAEQRVITSVSQAADESGVELRKRQANQFRAYFTRGAPAIGLLNAATGVRRFVLKPALIEALVLAMGQREMTYENFVGRWLHGRLGLVIDDRAARLREIDQHTDMSVFEDNSRYFAETMDELGLMRSYSDATRMVQYGY